MNKKLVELAGFEEEDADMQALEEEGAITYRKYVKAVA